MFNDGGLAGILEGADIKKLNIISPFIGSLVNRVCGEDETFPITKVFTEYVHIV